MTRFPTFVAALCLSVLAAARPAAAALTVVTTTSDLAAIVTEVGGDKVSVTALARGYQDPHFVEAKPSFVLLLNKAQLLVVVGRVIESAVLLVGEMREHQVAQAGGFDERLFAGEEIALSRTLARQGRVVILREKVVTSGRKMRTHSFRELLGTLARIILGGPRVLEDRGRLGLWYGPRRRDRQER